MSSHLKAKIMLRKSVKETQMLVGCVVSHEPAGTTLVNTDVRRFSELWISS